MCRIGHVRARFTTLVSNFAHASYLRGHKRTRKFDSRGLTTKRLMQLR
jgi:hypothetical protein